MRGFLAWRQTPQKVDPVVVRSIFPLIGAGAVGVLIYAVVRTAVDAAQITSPLLSSVAIALVVVSAIAVIATTDPVRSPAGFVGFAIAVLAINAAAVASALSLRSGSLAPWDGWGPLAVAVIVLCFAEFRPGRDLAAATVFSVIVTGATVVIETASVPGHTPLAPWSTAVIATIPIVVFGVAASVFSYRLSLVVSQRQEASAREQGGLARRVRIRLRELLRDSGRVALSAELVPFIEGILDRGEVSAADNAEARRISAVLRSVIIADMGLPWLDRMQRAHPDSLLVHDDNRLAETFTMEQKVALRALITAVLAAADGQRLHVRINAVGRHRSVFLRVPYAAPESTVRRRLGTFITVMAAVFGRSTVTVAEGELRLLFAYEELSPGAESVPTQSFDGERL